MSPYKPGRQFLDQGGRGAKVGALVRKYWQGREKGFMNFKHVYATNTRRRRSSRRRLRRNRQRSDLRRRIGAWVGRISYSMQRPINDHFIDINVKVHCYTVVQIGSCYPCPTCKKWRNKRAKKRGTGEKRAKARRQAHEAGLARRIIGPPHRCVRMSKRDLIRPLTRIIKYSLEERG